MNGERTWGGEWDREKAKDGKLLGNRENFAWSKLTN